MASRTPEFGKWDEEDVPYSQVFDKARKNRTDLKTNQDSNPYDNLVKSPKHDARRSPRHEDADLKRVAESSLRPTSSPYHHHQIPNRNGKHSAGSDHGFDHNSPLHPQQPKTRATLNERKGSFEGSHSLAAAPSTPGRSRLKQITRKDGTSNQSAVPKFGDWDENDPASAEGLTAAFEMVGKERQNTAGRVPTRTTDHYSQPNRPQHHPVNQNSKKCGCFPWGGM